MLSNLRENQQNNQLENQINNQVEYASIQQPIKFRSILFLLYSLMLLIVISLLISIVVANKNRQSQQILILGILLIPLLTVLLGCTFYTLLQLSEAEERFKKIPQEMQLNKQIYQSSITFFFFYTNQSKFTIIRLTQLYIIFAICILIQKIIILSQDEFYFEENQNLDDNSHNMNNNDKKSIQPQMLLPLFILLSVLTFIFLMFEIMKIILIIYFNCRNQPIPSYQYNDLNLNILKVIRWSKAFCVIFLVNHIAKMMILCTIFVTPNSSSYVLIGSNLFYHFFMATIINTLFNDISSIKRPPQSDCSLFINHQILIDSIIKNMHTRKVFQILILISFIFTIVGTCIFRMDEQNEIINHDIFIFYDCAIFQLILLGFALFKYLISPHFNKSYNIVKQSNQVDDQQLQTVENQQIRLSTEQLQIEMMLRPQSDQMNGINQISRSKLPRISNILKNNILQTEDEKQDCIICLQPMIKNIGDQLIQLNCHSTHIFHKKCIRDWLAQNKKCPLCNTAIL
ncbi:unnamed protein product [Paramecium sonneborni]|uniref:RING-type domain-containing protein n=1 Tax=Paramecium sonneborni TaxID=65129 RepID=A0A8S1QAB2_9CILI|nr:unnamed protein product [Paramecium sonneborni]